MKILVSIIIPIYNMEKYLSECLSSLQRQHFDEEVEILLLDDGSTDTSGKICDDIALKDKHFRVFHQENQGVAATRNHGLREAYGKYIAWVDPDDYITDDWWQVLKPVLVKGPDMVYFDMKMLKNGQITESHFDSHSRVISRNELFQELANGNRIQSHLWSKIFLRALFKQSKTFNEKMGYCEDYQALHKITFSVHKCMYLCQCLYVYRQRVDSLVHDEEKAMSNSWLGVVLSQERRDFYYKKGIHVSNLGVLYSRFLFCVNYQIYKKNHTLPIVMDKHYHDCIHILRGSIIFLLRSKFLTISTKVHLILLLYHLYFLLPILKNIKNYLFEK